MPADGSETVLCVPSVAFRALFPAGWGGHRNGFLPLETEPEHRPLERLMQECVWIPRTKELERNPTWKQVLPYGILYRGGRVLWYRRVLKNAGEDRLAGKYSVGVGGHINTGDVADPKWFSRAIGFGFLRELKEEFGPRAADGIFTRTVGLINDDSNDVGTVHLGIVFAVKLKSFARINENRDEVSAWGRQRANNLTDAVEWESWSRLLLPHLPSLIKSA